MEFKLVHLPDELMQYQDSATKEDYTVKQFQLLISPQNDQIELFKVGIDDSESLDKRIQKLEFKTDSLFTAEVSGQTLLPVFTHYENYRGIKEEVLIHLHFETMKEITDDFTVVLNDFIFQSGEHRFVFEADKLNNPPLLKTIN